jgi:LysW-gamma-L-lysine carboxypeptidase
MRFTRWCKLDELATLERLVHQYSPSGQEAAAVREFVRIARAYGYRARVDAVGNGIASRGTGRPRIVFLGHIDTVDGDLPVRRRGGRLYGRGAVDAKGPLVAALLAGRESSGPGEYRVIAAVGEETDSRGARHIVGHPAPDATIIGEPSGWDGITIGYKGMVKLVATFRGQRSHYSSPAPTAMDRAIDWVGTLRAFVAGRSGPSLFHSLTMKVVGLESQLQGDDETAVATIDLRLPPGASTSELMRSLPRAPGPCSFATKVRDEPIEVARTNPVVAALVSGVRAAGGRPTLWRKGGTSDLSLTVRAWSVPAAAYGPGNARLDHTSRECISAEELRRSVTVLRVALESLRTGPLTPR